MENSSPKLTILNVSSNSLMHLRVLFFICFIFSTNITFSQTNNCDLTASAGEVTVGASCNYSNFNSNFNNNYWNGNTCSADSNRDDAWGWFTATSTSTIINYQPTNGRDAILHLFTGTCSTSVTALACSNIGGNGELETITYPTIIGQKYMIRIQRNNSDGSMNGQICVYSPCQTSAGTLSGNQYICRYTNTSTTFSSSVSGGTWTSSNTSVANVNASTGLVTAVNSGTATITYTVGGGSCPTYTSTRTVYVANGPGNGPISLNGSNTQCTNSTTTYTIVPDQYSSSYIWSYVDGGSGATITPAADGLSATVTFNSTATSGNIRVQSINGCGFGGGGQYLWVNITNGPNITSQPVAPTTVCAGSGTRTISVTATSATSFQWRRNGVNISNGTPYSGATSSTLTITNPVLAIAGNFDVVVSNGSCSRTSNAVALNVSTTPTINTNPIDSSITEGSNTSFTVGATNSPSSYSWQVSTNGGGTWSTVTNGGVYSGATTATLVITNAALAMDSYRYRVSATNSCGTSTFSTSALLTVSPVYCTPSVSSGREASNYITTVNFIGNIINTNNSPTPQYSSSPRGYQDWSSLGSRASQAQGEGVNLYVDTDGGANYLKAWVDWNKDGTFDTSTEVVYQCTSGFLNTTFGFQIPSSTTPGDYRIRLRINRSSGSGASNSYGPCGNIAYYGETEDYLFTVVSNCSAKITSITNGTRCGTGSVTLNAVGSSGTTEYRWYSTATGGTYISSPSSSWNTPSINNTTTYYVTAYNGSCESLYRTAVVATVKKVPALTFSNSSPEICGEDSILELSASGTSEQVYLVDESFEGSSYVFTSNQIASPDSSITNWQIKTSTYVPPYPTYPVWYPAISSGFGNNKFMMSTSDLVAGGTTSGKVNEALELTNSVNTVGFTDLTLTFKIYFSSYYDANNANTEAVFIETNDGSGWSSTPVATYLSDEGIGTKFVEKNIPLNSFVNISNFKIRIRYRAGWCDGVAIDDVKIFGNRPLVPNFTWTSGYPIDAYVDLACTIPYTTGTPVSTVYIKPTLAQLENANYSFTANANLTNGCTTSGTVNVTNKSKVWKGTVNSNWNDVDNWSPAGIPTSDNCVVIPNNTTISGTNYNAFGKNLTVKNGGTLNIQPSNNLIITDFVKVESTGTFQLENNSNLVQINNTTNSGNIIYKRTANNIKGSDYVYWSSPVNNQALNSIYTSPSQGPKYSWNPTLNNSNGGQGNYVNANGVTMGTGIGYLVRGSSSFGMAATNINSTFTGRPNNGTIPVTVNRGSHTGAPYNGTNGVQITNLDDNYNLIGNPYPSSINALQFISDNASVIRGNVQLWTHGTDPGANNGTTITNPFYGSYSNNYSASDYVTINYTGATIPSVSEIIKAGQAFFVEMLDGPTGSGTVSFNNTQRRDNTGIPYANDEFFKNSNQQNVTLNTLERHRIWLDIKDSNNVTGVALIGYIEGATMNDDSAYDAFATTLDMGIYSFIDDQSYIIQGRSLPFDDNDQVQIGFNVPTAGNYTIGLNSADGIFLGTQDIYLKDEMLNIYHDLKSSPYSFTATAGVHNDRFKLVYKNTVLSNTNFNENEFQIAKNKNIIDIVSGNETIDNVKVFDVRGRLLVEKTKINNNSISIDMNSIQDQVLIINIVTTEGIKVTRKIL
ncbi:GEVED domain-containing protein [Flavobacterium ponti]|uniref:GEVED domain-containing protein n=1 Tax=Flavobacterium ponti TaxID=665133 RepID=A0ABV9NZX6_9FLAO